MFLRNVSVCRGVGVSEKNLKLETLNSSRRLASSYQDSLFPFHLPLSIFYSLFLFPPVTSRSHLFFCSAKERSRFSSLKDDQASKSYNNNMLQVTMNCDVVACVLLLQVIIML